MLLRQAAAPLCPDDPKAHFGGPDVEPHSLRDLLLKRIADTPPGGKIFWATYYFRDEALAQALMRASDRGVEARLVLEGAPHHHRANRSVLRALKAHGLGGGLRIVHDGFPFGHPLHLHAKVYAFSHHRGCAFVGTYNPTGDQPGDAMESLGDHDRGHNYLVEISDPKAIDALARYVDRLFVFRNWAGLRRDPKQNRVEQSEQIGFHFFPRTKVGVLEAELRMLGAGDRAVGCVSHIDDGATCSALACAASRGAGISLHLGGRGRRISDAALKRLHQAGVDLSLHAGCVTLPMHCKFLVLRRRDERKAFFGSFNLNRASRWLNHEVLCSSTAPALLDAFEHRFDQLRRSAQLTSQEAAL